MLKKHMTIFSPELPYKIFYSAPSGQCLIFFDELTLLIAAFSILFYRPACFNMLIILYLVLARDLLNWNCR